MSDVYYSYTTKAVVSSDSESDQKSRRSQRNCKTPKVGNNVDSKWDQKNSKEPKKLQNAESGQKFRFRVGPKKSKPKKLGNIERGKEVKTCGIKGVKGLITASRPPCAVTDDQLPRPLTDLPYIPALVLLCATHSPATLAPRAQSSLANFPSRFFFPVPPASTLLPFPFISSAGFDLLAVFL